MQLLHIDIISGFLLILGVESIAHKLVDHKGKGKVEYQTNNNEDGDDFNVGDTPDDMKLKIPRISGQGDGQSHRSTNCQDDHLTIPVPTSNRKPLPSVSPCFSSKKVLGIRITYIEIIPTPYLSSSYHQRTSDQEAPIRHVRDSPATTPPLTAPRSNRPAEVGRRRRKPRGRCCQVSAPS